MNFQRSTPYTRSELEVLFVEYEKSTDYMLNLRAFLLPKRAFIKILCKNANKSTCEFKLIFLRRFQKGQEVFYFKYESSVQCHNHQKITLKERLRNQYKNEFKNGFGKQIKDIVENNFQLTPKEVFEKLNSENKLNECLVQASKVFKKEFKKTLDNTVNKMKKLLIKLNSSSSLNTAFLDNNSTQIELDSNQSKNFFVGDNQEDTFSGDVLEEIAREQQKILIIRPFILY